MPFMPYYGMFFDPTYILIIIGAVISMWASMKVNTTYQKYSTVRSASGITGAEAAARILRSQGLHGVQIEHVHGNLTDHYDPRSKVLRLSDAVYNSTSVAAIGVAAHECGHAIQDQQEYTPLRLRSAIVPVAQFGSYACWLFIAGGVFFGFNEFLINLGILLFSLSVIFQLVTLPVEFDASKRALAILGDTGILGEQELKGSKKVLSAAALTYVAAAAAAILSLLRLLILFGNRRD